MLHSAAASSSSCSLTTRHSASKRTRATSGEPGGIGVGEGAMAWEAAAVKREVKTEAAWEWEAAPPRPMEGLGAAAPAPFVAKTYEMVADAATDAVVSWGPDGRGSSFVVWDPLALAAGVLPRFFKHANFSSFVRQLNTYGFRKINPDRWEFANEAFLAGKKHLLRNIKRRRASKHQIESKQINGREDFFGQPVTPGEVRSLQGDITALSAEIITLKQQYNSCKSQLIAMEERVLKNERNQQQIITFFAKVFSNPVSMQQVLLNCVKEKEIGGTVKRQRLMESEERHVDVGVKKSMETSFVMDHDVLACKTDSDTVGKDEPTPKWNFQSVDHLCDDDVWEELDAIPGTGIEKESKAEIVFNVEEFTGRPCGWVDDCPYLPEPMQFVEY